MIVAASNVPSVNTAPGNITVTASPFTYQNTSSTGKNRAVFTSGGTVTLIEHSYNGSTWITTGDTQGLIILRPNDRVRVTYSVAPTMNYIDL